MVSDKSNAFGEENQNEKSNGVQLDLCDVEQVVLKQVFQADCCLAFWLQIWYHSLLWENDYQKTQHRNLNTKKLNTLKLNTKNSTQFGLLNTFIMYKNRDVYYTCKFLVSTPHNLCI